jgi:hypothetical protein
MTLHRDGARLPDREQRLRVAGRAWDVLQYDEPGYIAWTLFPADALVCVAWGALVRRWVIPPMMSALVESTATYHVFELHGRRDGAWVGNEVLRAVESAVRRGAGR